MAGLCRGLELRRDGVDAGRSSDADGHGLGLPIARAIAAAHGATLTSRARPGGGMHVQVRFPASEAVITQREPQTAEARTGIIGL